MSYIAHTVKMQARRRLGCQLAYAWRVDLADRIKGCLLAGAAGDALGAPVEFLSWAGIQAKFGPDGVTALASPGRFTDDTQMTLFTLEGLIRASVRGRSKGICHPPSVVRHAYLRWLHTQGVPWPQAGEEFAAAHPCPDGWLVSQPSLHRRMAPGSTCLSALRAGGGGTVDSPANDSKGCGAVMRAAPVGFFFDSAAEVWGTACEIAAITHGHADGIHSAGVLAVAIRLVADGRQLASAIRDAATFAPAESNTRQAVTSALELAASGPPDPATLNSRLGDGWVGEEALAIAACCAVATPTPAAALLAAVNHSGDSDSTGSIAGNLVGAAYGPRAVPPEWLDVLDGADLVEQISLDAATELLSPPSRTDATVPDLWANDPPEDWWSRYPGW